MIYLVCQEWKSTKGNHAGMKHMCDMICELDNEFKAIVLPEIKLKHNPKNQVLRNLNILLFYYSRIYFHNFKTIFNLLKKAKKGDEIILLEYLHKSIRQYVIAKYLRKFRKGIKISSLQHLTPSVLKSSIPPIRIKKELSYIDKVYTLGTSLSSYLTEIGINPNIIRMFPHYVDNVFYHREKPISQTEDVKIICQGNLQRNFDLLRTIVDSCPSITFTILAGRNNSISTIFSNCSNVRLLPYLSEEDLRNEMLNATVSLNVMEDTVGSNVITTSMAMGHAMIVSDVGSIRDYCTPQNAYFCKTASDFINAINNLATDKKQLFQMRVNSLQTSKQFEIGYIIEALKK